MSASENVKKIHPKLFLDKLLLKYVQKTLLIALIMGDTTQKTNVGKLVWNQMEPKLPISA